MGGQQVLTWAIFQPNVFKNIIPIACNATQSAWSIAINEAQRMAIESDTTWTIRKPNAGLAGLKAAMAMSMITLLANRFDAFSYWTLTKTMDNHDVSRGHKSPT